MIDYIIRLNDEINKALFHIAVGRSLSHNRDVIKRLKPEISRLEKDKEFRDYIRETLKDKNFHDNFPYSYRKFPFSIIAYLDHIGVPPEKNFLIQDIITTLRIENRVFIEYLIKELKMQYFPQDFKKQILSDEQYRRLYNLTSGYEVTKKG
ncbi:hypothetical protein LCGC14_0935580 [marine sediment metagenome]|uniref:Uncharacterized protein n=1 Tax=marine sediment metagenome TaxID=412755 RepID=A0A0F9RT42_9ZZZZ